MKPKIEVTALVQDKNGQPQYVIAVAEVEWIPMNMGVHIDENPDVYSIEGWKVLHGNGHVMWPFYPSGKDGTED